MICSPTSVCIAYGMIRKLIFTKFFLLALEIFTTTYSTTSAF